jgi:hypothetical protein
VRTWIAVTAVALAGLIVTPLSVSAGAATVESNGCKGIDVAYGKASAKGKLALEVVAAKFNCGTIDPGTEDPTPCPSGQTALARWTYTGTLTGPVEWGYPTWEGTWTNTLDGPAYIQTTWGNVDGNGFYWGETTPDIVKSITMRSFTGEVKNVTDGSLDANGENPFTLDPGNAVSQNWFTDRTGINLVTFCG